MIEQQCDGCGAWFAAGFFDQSLCDACWIAAAAKARR